MVRMLDCKRKTDLRTSVILLTRTERIGQRGFDSMADKISCFPSISRRRLGGRFSGEAPQTNIFSGEKP